MSTFALIQQPRETFRRNRHRSLMDSEVMTMLEMGKRKRQVDRQPTQSDRSLTIWKAEERNVSDFWFGWETQSCNIQKRTLLLATVFQQTLSWGLISKWVRIKTTSTVMSPRIRRRTWRRSWRKWTMVTGRSKSMMRKYLQCQLHRIRRGIGWWGNARNFAFLSERTNKIKPVNGKPFIGRKTRSGAY